MRFRSLGLLVVLALPACSASRQTAVVTQRPPVARTDSVAPPPEVLPEPPRANAPAPRRDPALDTVRAGRFDGGKMWTFDAPPAAYFQEAYGFRPDTAWFRRARLGALRLPNCSASFVSPGGLVMTNHHCARESVTKVSRRGENLLQNGFYAKALADERAVVDLYLDQLIALRDVTDDVRRGVSADAAPEQAAEALESRSRSVQERLDAEAKRRDDGLTVQVVALYDGARYSAYTFRRFKDVRLVMAPEVDLGFFGGDPDNFTYPRYALDMSFFRVYEDGQPLRPEAYYRWSTAGVKEGDAVFVIGNPGSTSRGASVAQLEYERDVQLPQNVAALDRRLAVLGRYLDARPAGADTSDLRNAYFDLSNARKAYAGSLAGLRDPLFIARKAAGERTLLARLDSLPDLRTRANAALSQLDDVQGSKRALAPQAAAFTFFGASPYDSPTLTRAFYGFYNDALKRGGAGAEQQANVRKEALALPYWPAEVDRAFLALRLEEMRQALGADNVVVRRLLGGRTPDAVAADLIARTTLRDSVAYKRVLDRTLSGSGDVMTDIAQAVGGLFIATIQQQQGYTGLEGTLRADLARARFAVYGNAVPPDASFSLRIADGIVSGYPYNGTQAPAYTTFHGLYDRHFSNPTDRDFALPRRWLPAPAELDLSTPLNLVATADIAGGNSGSAMLNRNLEVVGLVFDSNIDAVPNDYLYRSERGRSVAVDARAILETLGDVYDMDRLVLELTRGTVARTEAEADAQRR